MRRAEGYEDTSAGGQAGAEGPRARQPVASTHAGCWRRRARRAAGRGRGVCPAPGGAMTATNTPAGTSASPAPARASRVVTRKVARDRVGPARLSSRPSWRWRGSATRSCCRSATRSGPPSQTGSTSPPLRGVHGIRTRPGVGGDLAGAHDAPITPEPAQPATPACRRVPAGRPGLVSSPREVAWTGSM